MVEQEVRFESAGSSCVGWLTSRGGDGGLRPAVVMAPGFGVLGDFWASFAERFADAGFVVLRFDYRHFGRSGGEPRQLLNVGRQLEDLAAAVRYVRARDDVDGERVALWGSSFGGGHVLEYAARDGRIAAVVAQVPFVDGLATVRTLRPVQLLRLAGAGLQDELASLARRPRRRCGIVGPPGALAAMTTPDAEPGYLAMVPPDSPWQNRVCACIALTLPLYRPIRAVARVRCPLLVCVADCDAICPPRRALAAAARAPRGTSLSYPGGHFDLYREPLLERVCHDQAQFLAEHLVSAAPTVAA